MLFLGRICCPGLCHMSTHRGSKGRGYVRQYTRKCITRQHLAHQGWWLTGTPRSSLLLEHKRFSTVIILNGALLKTLDPLSCLAHPGVRRWCGRARAPVLGSQKTPGRWPDRSRVCVVVVVSLLYVFVFIFSVFPTMGLPPVSFCYCYCTKF